MLGDCKHCGQEKHMFGDPKANFLINIFIFICFYIYRRIFLSWEKIKNPNEPTLLALNFNLEYLSGKNPSFYRHFKIDFNEIRE